MSKGQKYSESPVRLYKPGEKEFDDLHIEVSKLDISADENPESKSRDNSNNKEKLDSYLANIPLFKELDKYKTLYEKKQNELLQYFVQQNTLFKQRIADLQKVKPKEEKPAKATDFRGYQDDPVPNKPQSSEVKFLIALKQKVKLLHEALNKERADKLKLAQILKREKIADMTRTSRVSMKKTTSLVSNPFAFSEEKQTHRFSMAHRPRGDSSMLEPHDDNDSKLIGDSLPSTQKVNRY